MAKYTVQSKYKDPLGLLAYEQPWISVQTYDSLEEAAEKIHEAKKTERGSRFSFRVLPVPSQDRDAPKPRYRARVSKAVIDGLDMPWRVYSDRGQYDGKMVLWYKASTHRMALDLACELTRYALLPKDERAL